MPPMPDPPSFSWFTRDLFCGWMQFSRAVDEYTSTSWWYRFYLNAPDNMWRYVDEETWEVELYLLVVPPPKVHRYV